MEMIKKSFLFLLFVLFISSCFIRHSKKLPDAAAVKKDYRRALYWMEQGDLLQAEAYFRFALARDTLFVPACAGMGQIYLQRNKLNGARRWLDKALRINADYLPARLLRARLFWRLSEYGAAEKDLRRCRQLIKPNTPNTLKAQIYLLEGRLNSRFFHFKRSVNAYQKILQIFPGQAIASKELQQAQAYLKYSKGFGAGAGVKGIVVKKQITRADLAVLLSANLNFLTDSLSGSKRSRRALLETAVRREWLPLFPDSSFRPNHVIDRAELTISLTDIIIKYGLDKAGRQKQSRRRFTDLEPENPLSSYVQIATAFNLLDFISGDHFYATKKVSGLEAFKSLKRLTKTLKTASLPANGHRQKSQYGKER